MHCVIYGSASSYTSDVVEVLGRASWTVVGFVDNATGRSEPTSPFEPEVSAEDIPSEWFDFAAVIPIVTPGHRITAEREARSKGFTRFPPVVDPTSVVGASAEIGDGCIVNAGVVIAAGAALEPFAGANRSASIGHDAVIESYSFVGPAGVLCGGTRVGRGSFVGAAAVLLPNVKVGPNSVVAAGAVVTKDVEAQVVVAGNPARIIEEGIAGYRGLAV